MKKYYVLLLLICVPTLLTARVLSDSVDIANIDPDRYMGCWYQIVRFDHRFERDMVGVTITYNKEPNGMISVIKKGYIGALDGQLKKTIGRAKFSNIDGKLAVSFFLWFYYDKYIYEVCPNYTYSVVGDARGKYLWILSRTPKLEQAILDGIIKRLEQKGVDISKLIYVQQ